MLLRSNRIFGNDGQSGSLFGIVNDFYRFHQAAAISGAVAGNDVYMTEIKAKGQ